MLLLCNQVEITWQKHSDYVFIEPLLLGFQNLPFLGKTHVLIFMQGGLKPQLLIPQGKDKSINEHEVGIVQ